MRLTRFEMLSLLPDSPEVRGYGIEITPSGRVVLADWQLPYETFVDSLPEASHAMDARLARHKPRPELGLLIHLKLGTTTAKQVSFYLIPDLARLKRFLQQVAP